MNHKLKKLPLYQSITYKPVHVKYTNSDSRHTDSVLASVITLYTSFNPVAT